LDRLLQLKNLVPHVSSFVRTNDTVVAKKNYSKAGLAGGDRLLKAVKEKLLREKGKVDYAALQREGYGEELLARIKEI
jgi:hypothetical protein